MTTWPRPSRRPPVRPPSSEAPGLTVRFGTVTALDGLDLTAPAGRGPGHPRSQRRRQDHLRPHRGHPGPARRPAPCGCRGHDVARRPAGRPPDHRPGRPVRRRRAHHDRPGEPGDDGPALRPRPGRGPPGRRHRHRPARAWRRWPTAAAAPIPGASAAASTWAPAWSAPPACSCWTSPPPASTPPGAARCGTPSGPWWRRGPTSLLTTHYLDEADELADQVVVIDHGRAIASGTLGRPEGRASAATSSTSSCPTPAGSRRPPAGSWPRVTGAVPRLDRTGRPGQRPRRRRAGAAGRRHRPAGRRRPSPSTRSASAGPPSTRSS